MAQCQHKVTLSVTGGMIDIATLYASKHIVAAFKLRWTSMGYLRGPVEKEFNMKEISLADSPKREVPLKKLESILGRRGDVTARSVVMALVEVGQNGFVKRLNMNMITSRGDQTRQFSANTAKRRPELEEHVNTVVPRS